MVHIKESIEERKKELELLIVELEKRKNKYPEGTLRVSKTGKRATYYYVKRDKDQSHVSRKYISKTNMEFIQNLAQKEYEEMMLKRAYKEQNRLEKMLKGYEDEMEIMVFNELADARKSIVNPIILSQEKYVEEWQSVSYKGKVIQENDTTYTTEKGEIVRSKSEKILADKFYKYGIPYRYEYPLQLKGGRVIYPDFLLLNVRTRKEYYWEHLGMMDNSDYSDKTVKKINSYIENEIYPGEQLLMTYETKNYVNYDIADWLIKKYLL